MRIIGSLATNESSEMDIEGGIHKVLTHPSDAVRQSENSDVEMSDSSLDALLGRISEKPRQEIGSLTERLQKLHDTLQADRGRIRRDIGEYADLSKQVVQMAAIISDSVKKLCDPSISSDNVKKLPDAQGISRRNRRGRGPASAPQLIKEAADRAHIPLTLPLPSA
jgi:hypothetical protein